MSADHWPPPSGSDWTLSLVVTTFGERAVLLWLLTGVSMLSVCSGDLQRVRGYVYEKVE
jgi:hypothetical protein